MAHIIKRVKSVSSSKFVSSLQQSTHSAWRWRSISPAVTKVTSGSWTQLIHVKIPHNSLPVPSGDAGSILRNNHQNTPASLHTHHPYVDATRTASRDIGCYIYPGPGHEFGIWAPAEPEMRYQPSAKLLSHLPNSVPLMRFLSLSVRRR